MSNCNVTINNEGGGGGGKRGGRRGEPLGQRDDVRAGRAKAWRMEKEKKKGKWAQKKVQIVSRA